MQSIHSIRVESGGTWPATYAVEMQDGRTIRGLRRGDLASCRAFELAAALAGHHVRVEDQQRRDLDDLPAKWRRELWLRMVASGIAAGREEAPAEAPPSKPSRRGRRRSAVESGRGWGRAGSAG